VGLFIELPIELTHFDALGVEDVQVHLGLPLLLQCSHGGSQDLFRLGLASSGRPHQHEPVPDLNCVVELYHLVNKSLNGNEVHFLCSLLHCSEEISVVDDGSIDPWKQISDDILEKREIFLQKLGDVDIPESPQEQLVLVHIWSGCLEQSGRVDD
jgi:hypothetical protein